MSLVSLVVLFNAWCKPPNTKCKPNVIRHSLEEKLDIIDLQCCKYCHLLSVFMSKFQSSMTKIHYINVRIQNIPKVDEQKVNWDDDIC